MGWFKNMVKTWLDIKPANAQRFTVYQNKDFKTLCAINRLWLRGDAYELESFYRQLEGAEHSFWASVSTAGLEIKKSHSGLPQLMINKITDIVVSDYNGIECNNTLLLEYWKKVSEKNNFENLLEKSILTAIGIGDGALKYSFDKEISEYPLLEWYPADKIELIYKRGILTEIDFEDYYEQDKKIYRLIEKRGYGYITYELYDDDKLVPLSMVEQTKTLKNVTFNNTIMLATSFMIDKSVRFKGRGASKIEGKYDAFDSLDEILSQWIDAIRSGRAIRYIPETLCPRDGSTGEVLFPNTFDNRYLQTNNDMREDGKNKIEVEQPQIPTSNYLESYITYLGLCMQGFISPSTLGIDTKKLTDANASYERQMEKTTMFTRSDIIKALNTFIPKIVNTVWQFKAILEKNVIPEIEEITPKFGEFNSPSFDSQIETMSKARTSNILSVEAMVEELYGDSKTEKWKHEEIERIKNELGISVVDEPSINQDSLNLTPNNEEINE